MKEEKTKLIDNVLLERKTELSPCPIPVKDIPSDKIFDVRVYRDRPWIMFFMSREIYEELKSLCDERGLDVKKVIYGSIMKAREILKEGRKNEQKGNEKAVK